MTTLPIAALDLLRVLEPDRVESMEHLKYQQKTRDSRSSQKG